MAKEKKEKEVETPAPPIKKELGPVNALEERLAPSDKYIQECETKALNFINPKLWQSMKVMSDVFIQSNALPDTIKNAAQLMLVLQAGYEAGLQPVDSINSMYIVKGKVVMYGDTVISQVQKAGHKVVWGECNDVKAEVTIIRGDNGQSLSGTSTIEEAKKAGVLDKSQAWQKYPKRMLKYKAFAETAHFIVPDALKGIGIAEEFEGLETEEKTGVKIEKRNATLEEAINSTEDKPKEAEIISEAHGLGLAEIKQEEETPGKKKLNEILNAENDNGKE
jgi:hypothetical protein